MTALELMNYHSLIWKQYTEGARLRITCAAHGQSVNTRAEEFTPRPQDNGFLWERGNEEGEKAGRSGMETQGPPTVWGMFFFSEPGCL